jgi:hypothetical protein
VKYRKKPVVIEATQWFKHGDHPAVTPYGDRKFGISLKRLCRKCKKSQAVHGWVDALEGGYVVCPGDYIITGKQGEHYPCKPGVFKQTYEKVEGQ